VIARNPTGAAIKEMNALKIVWEQRRPRQYESAAYGTELRGNPPRNRVSWVRQEGDVTAALKTAEQSDRLRITILPCLTCSCAE